MTTGRINQVSHYRQPRAWSFRVTTGGDACTRFHTQIHERRGVSTVHREPNSKGRNPYVITSSHLDCSCRAQPEHAHRGELPHQRRAASSATSGRIFADHTIRITYQCPNKPMRCRERHTQANASHPDRQPNTLPVVISGERGAV